MGPGTRKNDGQWVFEGIVLAVGLLAYWAMFYHAGYSSGRHEERAHIEREHYAADAANYLGQKCGGLAGADLRKCIYEAAETERERQRDESDLAAQWKAADWVFWAALISGAQLIFTIAGLYYVKRNLDATWEAVAETRRIGEAQTRAYLSVSRCWARFEDDGISIKVEIRNSGQSPALDVCWQAEAGFTTPDTEGMRTGETPEDHRDIPYDIDAKTEREVMHSQCEGLNLGPEEAQAFADGKKVTMGVRVWAGGRDVFENNIETTGYFLAIFNRPPSADRGDIEIPPSASWRDRNEDREQRA